MLETAWRLCHRSPEKEEATLKRIGILMAVLAVALSGCGASRSGMNVPKKTPARSGQTGIAALRRTTDGAWVLPSTISSKAAEFPPIPEFSSWADNAPQPTYTFATWQPPKSWDKHLYKNLRAYDTFHGPLDQDPYQVLFITLQGVVFLYPASRQWPTLAYQDIPPGATIVAEYVPLLRAVKDGVVPVYMEPIYDSGYILPPPWQRALHMKNVEPYVIGKAH